MPPGVPRELEIYFRDYLELRIFCAEPYPPDRKNMWIVRPAWDESLKSFFDHQEVDDLSMKYGSLYFIAQSANDGSEFIGISLLDEAPGAIFYFRIQSAGIPHGMPRIAESFSEWLERTLDPTPYAPCPYWERPDFQDMGPAIPDDPFYVWRNPREN